MPTNSSRQRKESKLKKCLKFITLGKYQTNFFYEKQQDHFSYLGTGITLIGFLVVTSLSIAVLVEIFNLQDYNTQIQKTSDHDTYAHSLSFMLDQLDFKDSMVVEQQIYYPNGITDEQESLNLCGGYKAVVLYIIGDMEYFIPINCSKNYFDIDIDYRAYTYTFPIDPEYFKKWDQDTQDICNFTVLLTCHVLTQCFSNTTVDNVTFADHFHLSFESEYFDQVSSFDSFRSREYTFDFPQSHNFYFDQVISKKTKDVLQFNSEFQEDYYIIYRDQQVQDVTYKYMSFILFDMCPGVRPIDIYVLTPRNLASGLAQIGGYFSFFGIILVILRFFHRYLTNKRLQKYLNTQKNGESQQIDTYFSFERFATIEIQMQDMQQRLIDLEKENLLLRQDTSQNSHRLIGGNRINSNAPYQTLENDIQTDSFITDNQQK